MPWNDNANPGPWGSPPPEGGRPQGDGDEPKRPQRPGGGRRPPQPPEGVDLNEVFARLSAQLRALFGGGSGGGGPQGGQDFVRYIPAALGALVFLYFLSGIVIVGQRERAVVATFGAWTRTFEPGIGYHLPLFEKVTKVQTTLQKTEVGGSSAAPSAAEALMLTGDENIVSLRFTVNWRVSDPAKYLFNVAEADATIKAVAESAMREVVGRSPLDPILSTGKTQVQQQAAELMQRMLDSYDAGVIIDSVQIQDAQPPREVEAAFQEVASAGQQKEASINQAGGQAAAIRQEALGYKAQVVSEARGEAQRFNQIYEQYRAAPVVTRERLYIETMERVLKNSNRVIIDNKGSGAPIILPPEVFRPKNPTTAQPRSGGVQ